MVNYLERSGDLCQRRIISARAALFRERFDLLKAPPLVGIASLAHRVTAHNPPAPLRLALLYRPLLFFQCWSGRRIRRRYWINSDEFGQDKVGPLECP